MYCSIPYVSTAERNNLKVACISTPHVDKTRKDGEHRPQSACPEATTGGQQTWAARWGETHTTARVRFRVDSIVVVLTDSSCVRSSSWSRKTVAWTAGRTSLPYTHIGTDKTQQPAQSVCKGPPQRKCVL